MDCAELGSEAVELDHDQPPDGEGQREKDGHVVDHHCEVDVEQHE